MSRAPVLAFVGANGLVGKSMLPDFVDALRSGKISSLRVLTTRPEALDGDLTSAKGVEMINVGKYTDADKIQAALEGAQILVSAMGTKEGYHENKTTLLECAAKAGIKVYVPSEFGTDHNSDVAKKVDSPMFLSKQQHMARAEELGIKCLAFYNGLFLEMSFSSWLQIDISEKNPTWTIPGPEGTKCAFTSFQDIGRFVLSACLQAYADPSSVPSKLRVSSDIRSLDECADLWEQASGDKVTRHRVSQDEMWDRWTDAKAKIGAGALGPAIGYMLAAGGFDHSVDDSNPSLLRGEHAFQPRSVADFFKEAAAKRT